MFKRLVLVFVTAVLATGMLTGCGGSGDKKEGGKAASPVSSAKPEVKGFGDVYHDKAAAKKAYEEMKTKGGTPLMIFQNVLFRPDHISFKRQDQNKKENVDDFTWNPSNGWRGPSAVKLSGGGKLEDNLFNADEVNWEAIPDFVAQVEKEAKDKGIEKAEISSVMVMMNVRQGTVYLTASVKGERKDASAEGDIKTGKMTSFRIR